GHSTTWGPRQWRDYYTERAGVFRRWHLRGSDDRHELEIPAGAGASVSPLAVVGELVHPRPPRPLPVHGLTVHTTGGNSAREAPGDPLRSALELYRHGMPEGPHYLIAYDGAIHAICDENRLAFHAGWLGAGRARYAHWRPLPWWGAVWGPWHFTS